MPHLTRGSALAEHVPSGRLIRARKARSEPRPQPAVDRCSARDTMTTSVRDQARKLDSSGRVPPSGACRMLIWPLRRRALSSPCGPRPGGDRFLIRVRVGAWPRAQAWNHGGSTLLRLMSMHVSAASPSAPCLPPSPSWTATRTRSRWRRRSSSGSVLGRRGAGGKAPSHGQYANWPISRPRCRIQSVLELGTATGFGEPRTAGLR